MKFSGKIDIVISCTEKYIVTMDINQCGLYGNILTIHCFILGLCICQL